ncbi:MAG: hypothetical protein IJR22_04855 [Acidaminococcaceae bacterium]|nr:hypothetical protein [Acidaminococcaceae bacterium]
MRKRLAAVVLSLGLALGIAVMTDNTVQAQQAAEAARSENKTADVQAVAKQTEAASPKAEETATPANKQQQAEAAVEAEKQFPVTEAVADRQDVVAFTDAKNGFRVNIPAELQLYPLGINPVAVLRGENTAKGVRLAIDASAIDGKGPLMPFQVEAFREDFLRLVKSSVKDSANAKKILTSGEVELAGNKAVHVVSTTLTTDGKRRLLRDEYVFVTQNRMFVVMYMMDETRYPQYKDRIPEWMESVQISQVWKKISIAGTNLATEVPASCIDLKEPTETERTMEVYGNESIMVGLVSSPAESFGFMPGTLSGLQQADKAAVLDGLKQKLAADTKEAAKDYKGEFAVVNGRDCVKATYEVNGSKNESYTFVKDGKVIELGFVFKGENEKAVRPVIDHAVEKLEL